MKINEGHPLRRHFAAIVEQAFCEKVGMCDPSLTTYLVDLLLAFTHIDYLNTMRNIRNRNLERIASMLVAMSDEKPDTSTEREQATYRQIGDFTLFWAGVYPEQLRGSACKPADLLGGAGRGRGAISRRCRAQDAAIGGQARGAGRFHRTHDLGMDLATRNHPDG